MTDATDTGAQPVQPYGPTPKARMSDRRLGLIVVLVVAIAAVGFYGYRYLVQEAMAKAASGDATKTAHTLTAVLDDLGLTVDEAVSDEPRLHAAYLKAIAEPGADRPHDSVDVGIFYNSRYYACGRSTRTTLLGAEAPLMCVPFEDPDAKPTRVDTGGTFVVLNY